MTDPRLRHRPADHAALLRAAMALHRAGLRPRDIAAAIGLTEQAAAQLLTGPQPRGTTHDREN